MSVQIGNLEAEIGVKLFVREGRGIKLSEAGAMFLARARAILRDAEESVVAARRASAGEIGELAIGHNMPSGFRIFPRVVPAFRERWPDIHLTFHALTITEQLDQLRRGALDLAFVWLPIPRDGLDVHELLDEPLVAALPAAHRLAQRPAVSLHDLSGEPLIVPSRTADPNTFDQLSAAFSHAGARLNVSYELGNAVSMINFVAMGIGCALLADYARDIRQEGVVFRPLAAPGLSKTLAMVRRTDGRALSDTFYRFTIDRVAAQ